MLVDRFLEKDFIVIGSATPLFMTRVSLCFIMIPIFILASLLFLDFSWAFNCLTLLPLKCLFLLHSFSALNWADNGHSITCSSDELASLYFAVGMMAQLL